MNYVLLFQFKSIIGATINTCSHSGTENIRRCDCVSFLFGLVRGTFKSSFCFCSLHRQYQRAHLPYSSIIRILIEASLHIPSQARCDCVLSANSTLVFIFGKSMTEITRLHLFWGVTMRVSRVENVVLFAICKIIWCYSRASICSILWIEKNVLVISRKGSRFAFANQGRTVGTLPAN